MPNCVRAQSVLVVDIGGTHVKLLASGVKQSREFKSSPNLTPGKMVDLIRGTIGDWKFDCLSVGYPGPVLQGSILAEPHNLGTGWVGFDFGGAFDRPTKIVNDAAMQALGGYRGGKMLFLGFGTGLGTAMIVDGIVEPMEIGHLPYRKRTYEDYVGKRGLERLGRRKWRKHVRKVIEQVRAALQPDEVLIGGGNADLIESLPDNCRHGGNADAFRGGFCLWDDGRHASHERNMREHGMQLGMIGLGRMGANMARRLSRAGHDCVVYDVSASAVETLEREGATGASSCEELVGKLNGRRAVWLMVPAGLVDELIGQVAPHLQPGDILIDGGNSHYIDAIRRSKGLAEYGIDFVDVGTSGGVRGLERGYCMMIGGHREVVQHLDPIFAALAPGTDVAPRTDGLEGEPGTAEHGYLHCGASGAGHFVKMVHNGIEYGLMAAYAEGFNLLSAANAGAESVDADAETTPLRDPDRYRYKLPLADIAEVWRRGSVISSWLLDLTAEVFARDPALSGFSGRVADSGEGRWTIQAAIETAVPVPVLSAALYERFGSRGRSEFQNQLLSAMRWGFGGHKEKGSG